MTRSSRTQLIIGVCPKALYLRSYGEHTGVIAASCHISRRIGQSYNGDKLIERTFGGKAIAKLPKVIVAPAGYGTISRLHTGVFPAGRDTHYIAGKPRHFRWCCGGEKCVGAELSMQLWLFSRAPTEDAVIGG